jgi:hypothetical protein
MQHPAVVVSEHCGSAAAGRAAAGNESPPITSSSTGIIDVPETSFFVQCRLNTQVKESSMRMNNRAAYHYQLAVTVYMFLIHDF